MTDKKKRYRIFAQNINTGEEKEVEIEVSSIANVIKTLGEKGWCVYRYFNI